MTAEPCEDFQSYETKPPPHMTDDQLREFVLGCCDDKIFTSFHVHEEPTDVLKLVFMPIAFGALKTIKLDELGCIWEWWIQAGQRSINGYPSFFSMRVMHKDDWERAHKAIDAELTRRQTVVV